VIDGAVSGIGEIKGDVIIVNRRAGPGTSPGVLTVTGKLILTNTTILTMELAGVRPEKFDRLSVNGALTLGGTLAINLIDNFRPAGADSFAIVQANALSGTFANATNGQRVSTIDGYGSFQVNYSETNVVLSTFELNPAPTPTASARLNAPTLLLDSLELKLTGTAGREYLIETSTNLVTWSSAKTNVAGFDGQSLIELPASADSYRFFRSRAR
jgi:hypothetical protein